MPKILCQIILKVTDLVTLEIILRDSLVDILRGLEALSDQFADPKPEALSGKWNPPGFMRIQ